METSIGYTDNKSMEVSTTERKMINKIHALKQAYPNDVDIIREPGENYGMLYAIVPPSWLKIGPPRKLKRVISEEEKEVLRHNLALAREQRKLRDAG